MPQVGQRGCKVGEEGVLRRLQGGKDQDTPVIAGGRVAGDDHQIAFGK